MNFAAIVAKQSHGQQFAFSGFFERHDEVPRSAAGGNCDRDIVRLSLRNHLPQKNHFRADVIGDRRDIRGLERERNGRNGLPSCGRRDAVDRPIVGVGGRSTISKDNQLAAATNAF